MNEERGRRSMGVVQVKEKEEEGCRGGGGETKRLFRFSGILRFYICSPSTSDGCYISGKDC